MKTMQKDLLKVNIYDTRDEMGKAAGADIKSCILSLLEKKETINMIFAAAPSQNEVLYALATDKEIPWNRVNAFHMDEYIGLSKDAPQGFGNFLKEHIFGLADFKSVNYIDISAPDAEAECARYSELLKEYPTRRQALFCIKSTPAGCFLTVRRQGRANVTLVAGRGGTGIHAGDQSQHSVQRNDGGTTVADKGKGQTDNGHNTDTHTHINDNLEA